MKTAHFIFLSIFLLIFAYLALNHADAVKTVFGATSSNSVSLIKGLQGR